MVDGPAPHDVILDHSWVASTREAVHAQWAQRFSGARGVPSQLATLLSRLLGAVAEPARSAGLAESAWEAGRMYARQGRSASDLVDDLLALRPLVLDRLAAVEVKDEAVRRLGVGLDSAMSRAIHGFTSQAAAGPTAVLTRDPLSGVLSRPAFQEALGHEVAAADRFGAPSLVIVELAGINGLADQLGHLAGDLALLRVITLLREATRRSDVLGRLGSERFAMLLPRTDEERALVVARRVVARARATPRLLDSAGLLTLDLGLGYVPEPEDASALILAAGAGLQRAREAGDPPHRLGVAGR